jgi:predicted acetyltransferase
MSEIRILSPSDFDTLPRIFADAYPGIKVVSEEDRQRLKQRALKLHMEEPTTHFHGLFRHGKLLGIMCFYDFTMNFLGARIHAGGVGQVAVDLAHKKEHVAKEMMCYFLQHFRQRGASLVALYPFRPDFYRKMGFGYGTKMNQYRVRPTSLPRGSSKANIRYLSEDDKQALRDCYQRFAARTHGMMDKTERELQRMFGNPEHRIVGCEIDEQIQGYLVFTFVQGESFIINDITIHEFIYENRQVLSELLTFLHTQADQIRFVIINTQDEYFHHLLLDPRNPSERLIPDVYHETNVQGLGLMYRVIDLPHMIDLLGECDLGLPLFGARNFALKLTVDDSFLPENTGSLLLRFEDTHLRRLDRGNYEAEIRLDIADFSSLLAGTVDFRGLYRYGLADISSPKHVEIVNRIFAVAEKPMCTTSF